MIDKSIKDILTKRKALHLEDSFNIEKCWNEEINILCSDISSTIDFLENRCTADEFSWLSEVFDEIVEKSQSAELVECLYGLAKKYPEQTKKYNIMFFIDSAKTLLK